MKRNIKFETSYCNNIITQEACAMSQAEFDTIRRDEETPKMVLIKESGEILFNSHTCNSGYSGTCFCLSHPKKSWELWREKGEYNIV